MRLALLGKGKTGSKVIELLSQSSHHWELSVFDSKNTPNLENLKDHDVILSFLPGPIFAQYLDQLIQCEIPVVTGSTGLEWPVDLKQKIKAPWLYATNFSLGMNLVHQMINALKKASVLFDDYKYHLHEVHHTKKLDSPSGTALTWQEWIGEKIEITAERIGDVVGDHQIILETPFEKITLKHQALDRKIFAQGALWACEKVVTLPVGIHSFQEITRKELID